MPPTRKFSSAEIRNRHARTAGFALGHHRGLRPVRLAVHSDPIRIAAAADPERATGTHQQHHPGNNSRDRCNIHGPGRGHRNRRQEHGRPRRLSSFNIIVHPNDTLDAIFRRLKLNLADLASLRALPGLKAHLDSLHPGESLHFMQRDDGALVGLERRLNEEQTLKVSRDASGLKADVLHDPLEARPRVLKGVINSSLFEAVETAGGHDQTAVGLADIFGWDIDFVLDISQATPCSQLSGALSGRGVRQRRPILAASFTNAGRQYKAVRYVDPDGGAHYYTPDGRSMHKAFLRAPLEFTRVSSGFNLARKHPILNLIRAHKGVDYAAPIGTPVKMPCACCGRPACSNARRHRDRHSGPLCTGVRRW